MAIYYNDPVFILEGSQTSYCFAIRPSGHLEHLYYGQRLEHIETLSGTALYSSLSQPLAFLPGNTIAYSNDSPLLGLELLHQETSTGGKGDLRLPMVEIEHPDGFRTADFVYWQHDIMKGKPKLALGDDYACLPQSYGDDNACETLTLLLKDKNSQLELQLVYTVFSNCNVIVRSSCLINKGVESVSVHRLMSLQLDLQTDQLELLHFSGAWAREMKRSRALHPGGLWQNTSRAGVSSSRQNPLVLLAAPATTENQGQCYGFNLIYSGNHSTTVEKGSYGGLRVLSGVEASSFSQRLQAGEKLQSPEAIMSFSQTGLNSLSQNFHTFIRQHIVRGPWQFKERPILINSWEACYFNFNEAKLLKLAKAAKQVGVELFVLDDGWFGERHDDQQSLGDWQVNLNKLPGGLKGLADKINQLGLSFGLWLEPEMISKKSRLFEAHPEFALMNPNSDHSEGRHQMLLNLAEPAVIDYLYKVLSDILASAPIHYVKWDMNRVMTDVYSVLDHQRQQALSHRYYLGLYALLERLTKAFPEILFEGCASGGNRFDLGMLCYMPQIWASDNTDAYSRLSIQTGYSYGYPPSVMGAHVATAPNHQTLRAMPLSTRYHVAAFGLLGYELDLCKLDRGSLMAIKAQIDQYKRLRPVLQFGRFYRQRASEEAGQKGCEAWFVVSEALTQGVLGVFSGSIEANESFVGVKIPQLLENKRYEVSYQPQKLDIRLFGDLINQVSPIPIAQDSLLQHAVAKVYKMDEEHFHLTTLGSVLMKSGLKLPQKFCGMGHNEQVSVMSDYGSRLYEIHLSEGNLE